MLVGILVGAVNHEAYLGELANSMRRWSKIDPHLLLYTFLPALLFGDGCTLNFHLIKKTFAQIFLLACPGVLLGSFLTACVAKFILPYGWSWDLSMAFGSILAATDPVAVVALLKSVGASPKLTMLIAGESLMNDGTAVVVFSLFLQMIQGVKFDTQAILEFSFKVALGGPAIGLLVGAVCIMLMNLTDDAHVEITITVALAYLSFYIAEGLAGVSGVLSTVTFAVTFAAYAWPYVKNHDVTHEIWHFVEFCFNTVIFVLSGFIIGTQLAEFTGKELRAQEFGYLFVVYLMAIVIRAGMFVLFFPLLRRLGYGVTWKEAVVMVWGGLRGAVGLALAIVIEHEPKVNKRDSVLVFFFVSGIAVLTMCVNGTTTKALMKFLGMMVESYPEKQIYKDTRRRLAHEVARNYKQWKHSELFSLHNPSVVKKTVAAIDLHFRHLHGEDVDADINAEIQKSGDHTKHDIFSALKATPKQVPGTTATTSSVKGEREWNQNAVVPFDVEAPMASAGPEEEHEEAAYDPDSAKFMVDMVNESNVISHEECNLDDLIRVFPRPPEGDVVVAVRGIFLSMVRASYWDMVENGSLPEGSTCTILTNACDFAQDHIQHGIADWKFVESYLQPNKFLQGILDNFLPKATSSGPMASLYNTFRESIDSFKRSVTWEDTVHLASAFVEAHEKAQKQIVLYLGQDDTADTPEEKRVVMESRFVCRVAESIIAKARTHQPGVVQRVHTERMCDALLRRQMRMVDTLDEQGMLTKTVAGRLRGDIEHDLDALAKLDWDARFYDHGSALHWTGSTKDTKSGRELKRTLTANTETMVEKALVGSKIDERNKGLTRDRKSFSDGWRVNFSSDVGSTTEWYTQMISGNSRKWEDALPPADDLPGVVAPRVSPEKGDGVPRDESMEDLQATSLEQSSKHMKDKELNRRNARHDRLRKQKLEEFDGLTELLSTLKGGSSELGSHMNVFGGRVVREDKGTDELYEVFKVKKRRRLKSVLQNGY